MAAYLWTTWGNMVVIKAGGANGTTGGAETVGLAIGKWAGALISLVMAWVLLTVAVVYNYSFGRLLFVSGLEKRLPHQSGSAGSPSDGSTSAEWSGSSSTSWLSCSSSLARGTRASRNSGCGTIGWSR